MGGYLRTATGATPYATLSGTSSDYTVTIHATENGDALADGALATALANLKADGTDYNVTATGSDYVRMSLTNPSTSFTTAFGNSIHNKVVIGQLSFDSGEPALSSFVASYYSVSGNSDNSVPSDGDEVAEWIPASQTITISIEAITPAP